MKDGEGLLALIEQLRRRLEALETDVVVLRQQMRSPYWMVPPFVPEPTKQKDFDVNTGGVPEYVEDYSGLSG